MFYLKCFDLSVTHLLEFVSKTLFYVIKLIVPKILYAKNGNSKPYINIYFLTRQEIYAKIALNSKYIIL